MTRHANARALEVDMADSARIDALVGEADVVIRCVCRLSPFEGTMLTADRTAACSPRPSTRPSQRCASRTKNIS